MVVDCIIPAEDKNGVMMFEVNTFALPEWNLLGYLLKCVAIRLNFWGIIS